MLQFRRPAGARTSWPGPLGEAFTPHTRAARVCGGAWRFTGGSHAVQRHHAATLGSAFAVQVRRVYSGAPGTHRQNECDSSNTSGIFKWVVSRGGWSGRQIEGWDEDHTILRLCAVIGAIDMLVVPSRGWIESMCTQAMCARIPVDG